MRHGTTVRSCLLIYIACRSAELQRYREMHDLRQDKSAMIIEKYALAHEGVDGRNGNDNSMWIGVQTDCQQS